MPAATRWLHRDDHLLPPSFRRERDCFPAYVLILNCPIGAGPTDMARSLVPDDRTIQFSSDAVREHRAGKFDQDARDPIGR